MNNSTLLGLLASVAMFCVLLIAGFIGNAIVDEQNAGQAIAVAAVGSASFLAGYFFRYIMKG